MRVVLKWLFGRNNKMNFICLNIFQINFIIKTFTMAKINLIQDKSFAFAIRIVRVYQYLIKEKKEFILSKQLLKCGTSIGANVEESEGAQSRADFKAKISISYKESRETIFWIKLLEATDYLSTKEANSFLKDATDISNILGKIQLTLKTQA